MILKTFLATLSHHIAIGKAGTGEVVNCESFGGINVIFCGDFHQFPPVTCTASEALYQPQSMSADTVESQLGWAIYKEFTTVVILRVLQFSPIPFTSHDAPSFPILFSHYDSSSLHILMNAPLFSHYDSSSFHILMNAPL